MLFSECSILSQGLGFTVTAWFFLSFRLGGYEQLPDLRHTFATHALASGVDAKTLSRILGHTKASFTLDTYTHVTGDMHRNAAEIVGNVVTEWLGDELTLWQNEGNGATAAST